MMKCCDIQSPICSLFVHSHLPLGNLTPCSCTVGHGVGDCHNCVKLSATFLQVCEYVKHLAVENRCSHQAAIQHLANKKESLCKLLLRLRQYKKSAREMEAQVAANTMQTGAQGVPQQGMHAGFQNGMQAAMPVGMHSGMQAGTHGGTQPGMHPEGQSGAQNGVEGGPVQPAGPSELVEAMHDGLPTEMQAGMQNGVPSGVQDHPQG